MKLSELNAQCERLKAARADIHDKLHALLADESMPQGQARKEEAGLRHRVREINLQLYPMEMERAEIERMVKGLPRKQAESWLSEPVTLE